MVGVHKSFAGFTSTEIPSFWSTWTFLVGRRVCCLEVICSKQPVKVKLFQQVWCSCGAKFDCKLSVLGGGGAYVYKGLWITAVHVILTVWKPNVIQIIYMNVKFIPQRKHNIPTTETNRLMLYGETVAVCCENRTEHTDTLWAVRTSQETHHVSAA
jgi:hypothetical protein